MNSLKKLPMVLTVLGVGAASSFAEIKVGENLSLSGFLDMSLSGAAPDGGDATLAASFDQFEVDFLYKFGDKISARADLSQGGAGGGTSGIMLEQGFVTFTPGNGLALSAGRFLSTSGFEAAEPTGLFQYSYSKAAAYGDALFPNVYGAYQNGVNIAYTTPVFGLYGAIVSDLWGSTETDILNSPGFEGQIALTPAEGVTAKVAYLYQVLDDSASDDASQQLLNTWAQYAAGPLTVAAEYNMLIDWVVTEDGAEVNDGMGHGYLAMANFKFSDVYAATLRYSGIILGDADPDTEITFAPIVTFSPNWSALAEARYDIDIETFKYAVETIFTF